MSDLLRLLKAKERLWANCSGRSWQMSDRERFAQVAHDKWANERFTQIFLTKIIFLVRFIYVFLFKKTSDSLIPSFLMRYVRESLRLLTKNEWPWAIRSGPWANRSGHSPKMSKWANHSFFRKKRVICSENWWANSQTCKNYTKVLFLIIFLNYNIGNKSVIKVLNIFEKYSQYSVQKICLPSYWNSILW